MDKVHVGWFGEDMRKNPLKWLDLAATCLSLF